MKSSYILLITSVLIASISQIILKISSSKKYSSIIREYTNWRTILGYGLMFLSTILTILAFRDLDYKNGPIIEASGYIFIMILSRIILKEKITKTKLIGNFLILLGIIVFYI